MKKDDDQQAICNKHRINKSVIPRITSQQLFASANELIVQHNGEDYRLRITRYGKLILTK